MLTRCIGWVPACRMLTRQHNPCRIERAHDMSTTVVEGAALNASDRCDRCGAQAYVRVTMASGFELLFCAHHGKEHADKLKQVALEIHDESERIR
jgi:hypothetical protein